MRKLTLPCNNNTVELATRWFTEDSSQSVFYSRMIPNSPYVAVPSETSLWWYRWNVGRRLQTSAVSMEAMMLVTAPSESYKQKEEAWRMHDTPECQYNQPETISTAQLLDTSHTLGQTTRCCSLLKHNRLRTSQETFWKDSIYISYTIIY